FEDPSQRWICPRNLLYTGADSEEHLFRWHQHLGDVPKCRYGQKVLISTARRFRGSAQESVGPRGPNLFRATEVSTSRSLIDAPNDRDVFGLLRVTNPCRRDACGACGSGCCGGSQELRG